LIIVGVLGLIWLVCSFCRFCSDVDERIAEHPPASSFDDEYLQMTGPFARDDDVSTY
jgi:hypothetical protein